MRIFEKYAHGDYASYDGFKQNFHVNVSDRFNFAYNVLDVLGEEQPDKIAFDWVKRKRPARSIFVYQPQTAQR